MRIERKTSFFEKKEAKKLPIPVGCDSGGAKSHEDRKFFASFFQKRSSCFLRLEAGKPPPNYHYDIDIIILTMGRVESTLAAVRSALSQRDVSSYVAVLDQDFQPAAAARYADLLAGAPNAGYFVAPRNLGVAGGRNALAGLGRGAVIVAIDNDAVFGDAFVAFDAWRAFCEAPLLGAIGFRIMDGAGAALDERSWGYPASLKALAARRFVTTTFVGAGHAIRRAAWEDAGGYDADLFFTWEEYDFALRAIARGWRVEYRGDLTVRHFLAAEARLRWQGGRTRYFVRNRLMIGRKWGESWLALSPRIFGYLLKGALNGAFWASLRGVAGAVARDGGVVKRRMPARLREYVRAHEQAHRGSLLARVRPELLGRLADAPGDGSADALADEGAAGRARG